MRKLLTLLSVLMLICAIAAAAESPPASTPLPGYNLRASPDDIIVFATRSLKANIVGYLVPEGNQDLQVLDVSGDWCYISFKTKHGTSYGYVPLSYFDVVPQSTPTPPPQEIITEGTQAWVCNVASGYRLNLRQEPRPLAKSDGKYYTGTPLTLTGVTDGSYAQVLVAGTALGWMDLNYLTTDAESFVPEMPIVTITNSGVSLRSGPGSSFPRIGRVDFGMSAIVMGVRSDGWYHVQVGDLVGYVSNTYLSGSFPFGYGMDSDNPSLTNANTDHSSVFYINTRSSGSQLHLRKSASSSAKSLGLFYTGTPLTVINYTRTGWAYVRIGQTEGYMAADYFSDTPLQQYGSSCLLNNKHATGLNLRDTPSTGGGLLTFVPNGSKLTLLGELSNGWCYVDFNGTLGYLLNNGSLNSIK